MIVMPANATGWFWHSLARETGCLDDNMKIRDLEAEVARLNTNLSAHREKYDRIKEQLRQKQRVEDAARALLAAMDIDPQMGAGRDVVLRISFYAGPLMDLRAALAGKEG